MRIAVDARELAGRPTGVGRYLSELLAAWAGTAAARRHEWRLYAHAPSTMAVALEHTFGVLPGSGGSYWEQWTLARALGRDRPDLLFAPGYTAPLTAPCPIVLTVHDVSFAAHPEWFSPREGRRRRLVTAWAARRARRVLTDSAFSRDEIVRHLGIAGAKIRVVPPGITRLGEADAARRPEREPLILFVGSIFRRRHVDSLIAAFLQSIAPRLPASRLEIVGDDRTYPPLDVAAVARQAPATVAARVSIRSYVDQPVLADLYARASVFAFLSEYEGFGFTPLEALAAGVPALVLDTAVAREVCGPAARYVSDLSPTGPLAEALMELLTSDSVRRDLLRHAPAVLARYDWQKTAATTLEALEEAAGV